jgi:hypothetical protein
MIINDMCEKENRENETTKMIDKLPKYLNDEKGEIYTFIIEKNDWDGLNNAYILRYAKLNKRSISLANALIKIEGHSLFDGLLKMREKIEDYKKEGKIIGKQWVKFVDD